MKIAYYQDSHIQGKNSQNRQGNYYEDIMTKVRQVHTLAKENECDCIIHGGDIWENPVVSNLMVDEFIDMVESIGVPLYVVWGNHDLIGMNIETSKGSSLAHCFRRSKLINKLEQGGIVGKDSYFIEPYHYFYDIEQDIKENGIHVGDYDATNFKIAIVHAFITPKSFLPQVSHVVCDDIETDANLVLVAHYHHQWEKKVGNTTFLDIGCLGRLNINEHNIKPSMCIIDTDKRSWEVIELDCKKGSEIFDLEKAKDIKAYDKNMSNFISALQSTKTKELNIKTMVTNLCKEHKVEKEIENIILSELGE